ncbi:hypothetical protein EMCRGX_G033091 [Ephydatia muelleri]
MDDLLQSLQQVNVSTPLVQERPTYLAYPQLYTYDGCAEFVSDYLTYETLSIPNELPETLISPTTVLKTQKGNTFDYGVLLTSLLIGVGYDAYCVCGYATSDVTLFNQTRKVCPLLQEQPKNNSEGGTEKKKKYMARPPRDLNSKFLATQERKIQTREEDKVAKAKEEELAKIAEAEKPSPDKYYGMRFHCWVLVLSGKREVAQSFFLEPTTGEAHPLNWDEYLGIESVWNHKNYWINMQDCSQGVKDLIYDLGDAAKWEYFFPNVDKPLLVIPGEEGDTSKPTEEVDRGTDEGFQLPHSWVTPIHISPRDLENRCPHGKKTILYKKAKLEKFAEYLNQDGLVTKLTIYNDSARTEKVKVNSYFTHRNDRLQTRTETCHNGQIMECFGPGRQWDLKEHTYYKSSNSRSFSFYSYARVDGLSQRDISDSEVVEHFEKREDFLCYRHTTYAPPTLKFEPADSSSSKRPIQKIIERFHRNQSKKPNEDIAERIFLPNDNKLKVLYHLEDNRITPSTREFTYPHLSGDQGYILTYNSDMVTSYQVDPYAQSSKDRCLFEQLESLIKAQDDSIASVRASEQETHSILNLRLTEELNTTLSISVYDVARNEEARKHREELETRRAEEERIRKEKEMDYLAPFLARVGDPPTLDHKQAKEVAETCLQDLRTRLVDMANVIQARFEKETDELQKKQAWYKQNQTGLTKEKEAEYVSYCSDAMFRIHILEQRLNRHKTIAPQKYADLETRLKHDPRMAQYYGP